MNRFIKNIAKDYYAMSTGCGMRVMPDWQAAKEGIEDSADWISEHLPELADDPDRQAMIVDQINYYVERNAEAGFIQGFTVAMDLMNDEEEILS